MCPPTVLDSLRSPSDRRISLRVSPDAERLLRRGHPWLYDRAVTRQSHAGTPGDLAVVYGQRNRFLAIGLYDPRSPIRVRVLQHRTPASIDLGWFRIRLASAIARRAPLHRSKDTTGYRLIHGENDGVPGLVLDRYADTGVLKLYTAAWVPHLPLLLAVIQDVFPLKRLVLRLGRLAAAHPKDLHGLRNGLVLLGPPLTGPVRFREHGFRFEADPVAGQKTGFFLDQRDNRARVERLSRGAAVLDAFAYTGAFSVYAARGGAREVTSVDASRPALEAARRHFALNRRQPSVAAARHQVLEGNAFDVLERLRARRRRYDLVILDPPAFAKTAAERPRALAAYRRLIRLGLDVLRPGGVLAASSCTAQVSAVEFFATARAAAAGAGRRLREVARTGHPLDHPIGFPEGAYVKCLFAAALSATITP